MIKNLLISNNNFSSDKLHKITKGIATGAVIVTLTMIPGCSFSVGALTNPNSVIEEVSDNTCFDELLEKHVATKINMDLLEDYLNASDDLHSLKVGNEIKDFSNCDITLSYYHIEDETYYNDEDEEISREEFISDIYEFIDEYGINVDDIDDYSHIINHYYHIKAINDMINEIKFLKDYKKKIGPEQDRYYHDCIVLNNEEVYVNTWLRDVGYSVSSDYGLDLIKAKCCDACGYDEEHYSEFIVLPYDKYDGAYVKHEGSLGNSTTVKLGTFFGDNDLGKAALAVTNSQRNQDLAALDEEEFASYNKDRNSFLRGVFKDYSKVIRTSYKQKGSYIKQVNN